MTAVVTKATPTHAMETKAKNKQKQEGGRKPNTVATPSSSSVALCPTSDVGEGVRSLNLPTSDGWIGWDVREHHPGVCVAQGENRGSFLEPEGV